MNADEFVRHIGECAPRIEQLICQGLRLSEAETFQSSFFFQPRLPSEAVANYDDPILDLIGRYHCNHVELGMLSFNDSIEEESDYLIIGKDEADPLIMKKLVGEIQVIELGSESHVLSRCARDSSSFLDALANAERFLASALQAQSGRSPIDEKQIVARCSKLAGGDEYESFYRTFLNIWH